MVAFIASVGSVLGLGDNALILSAVQLSSTYTSSCDDDVATPEGCLAMGTPQVKGTFDFSVLPIPMVELGSMVIKKADIADTLLSLTGVEQANFEVESVTNAQRAGICGNGMCENGERCDSSSKSVTLPGNTTCCLMDCPFVSSTCPVPLSGAGANKSCAGNGICLDASGQCSCFVGYRGADCGQCALGWKPLNNNDNSGSCVKVASAEQFASMGLTTTMRVAPPPRSESGSSSFQAGFATAAVMGSAIMTCLLACYCFRNRSNHLHHHMRLNSDSPSPYQNPGERDRDGISNSRLQGSYGKPQVARVVEQVEMAATRCARTNLMEAGPSSTSQEDTINMATQRAISSLSPVTSLHDRVAVQANTATTAPQQETGASSSRSKLIDLGQPSGDSSIKSVHGQSQTLKQNPTARLLLPPPQEARSLPLPATQVQDNRSNPSTAKNQLSLSSSRPLSPPLIPGPPQTRSTQELLSTFSGLPPTYQQAVSQKTSIEPGAVSTYNLLPPTYHQVISQQPLRSSNEEPPPAATIAARLPLTYEQIIATRASPTLPRVETLDFM
jgi:hypothetical protein